MSGKRMLLVDAARAHFASNATLLARLHKVPVENLEALDDDYFKAAQALIPQSQGGEAIEVPGEDGDGHGGLLRQAARAMRLWDSVREERDALREENFSLQTERDATRIKLRAERDHLVQERDALRAEVDEWRKKARIRFERLDEVTTELLKLRALAENPAAVEAAAEQIAAENRKATLGETARCALRAAVSAVLGDERGEK